MRHPALAPHAEAFDELLERTRDGGAVNYDLPQPKWWFLHHLLARGFVRKVWLKNALRLP